MNQQGPQINRQEPVRDGPYGKNLEGRGVAQQKVRKHNRQLILEYLRKRGPALRADIAKSLDLSRATVTIIVKQLIAEGLIIEEETSVLANGILTNKILFNVNFGHIIGIDLGLSRLRIYLTNLEPSILDQVVEHFRTQVSLEKRLAIIAQKIRELLSKNGVNWSSLRGIGMGVPGAVSPAGTRVIAPPILKAWSSIDIPATLRELLQPGADFPIYIDSDANMGAMGESRYGRGFGIDNLIYLKLSTSMTAAFILKGQLYQGDTGLAGAFGHIQMHHSPALPAENPLCPSCNKPGCLEALTGLRAIVRQVHENPSSSLYGPLPEKLITPENLAEIILAASQGDAASRTALDNAGKQLGMAIGSILINLYNPALILLDGGMVRPSKDGRVYENTMLLAQLRKEAQKACLEVAWDKTTISLGQLGDDAVGMGTVATVIDRDPALNLYVTI